MIATLPSGSNAFDRWRQRRFLAYSIPVLAVFAALLFGAVMLLLLGADPIEGYSEMFLGAFGSGDALVATILKATPLLFVGIGIVIAFRANVINIGAEGQLVLGGLFATMAALYLPVMTLSTSPLAASSAVATS